MIIPAENVVINATFEKVVVGDVISPPQQKVPTDKVEVGDKEKIKVTIGQTQFDSNSATAKVTVEKEVYNKILSLAKDSKEEVTIEIRVPNVNGAKNYNKVNYYHFSR